MVPLPDGTRCHIFLSHNWGSDQQGRDNHARVAALNAWLKARGIVTWFDAERMAGDVSSAMCKGIDGSFLVMACVTKQYADKVTGDHANDNCKKEFNCAFHPQLRCIQCTRVRELNLGVVVPVHWSCCSPSVTMTFYQLTTKF